MQRAHEILFGLAPGTRLSAVGHLDPLPVLFFPTVGGLVLACVTLFASRWRWRKRVPVDPIEANAVRGGRLSLIDSVLVVVQNLISNGCGASVGMEAGLNCKNAGTFHAVVPILGRDRLRHPQRGHQISERLG